MAANGDMGVVIGDTPSGLVVALGKNDFWGFPGILLWHSSFDHFTPGQLRISIPAAGNVSNRGFSGSQNLTNAVLSGAVEYDSGYGLRLESFFVGGGGDEPWPNPNVATGILEVHNCPEGVKTADVELGIAAGPWANENIYGLPIQAGASTDSIWLIKENTRSKTLPPVMTPCSSAQIVYNSQRHFSLASDGSLTAFNTSATPSSPGRQLCMRAREGSTVIDTVLCSEAQADQWVLKDQQIVNKADPGSCLSVNYVNSTICQHQDLDPASNPICRTNAWEVVALPCDNASQAWSFVPQRDPSTKRRLHSSQGRVGFLAHTVTAHTGGSDGNTTVCLSPIPPPFSNEVATVVAVPGVKGVASIRQSGSYPEGASALSIKLPCGKPTRINIGMATRRDAEHHTPEDPSALSVATKLAAWPSATTDGSAKLLASTSAWWAEWWAKSSVELGPANSLLQRWYYTMLYLLRGSARADAVAPALWGPWSVSDAPLWGDEMTLDYNFEANFWSACSANHPELIQSYSATIMSLVPLSRQRAALADWSEGGWSDMYGGEVAGMSCGPTIDWDHDYGCPVGFGGFKGIEMPSATGPFEGMIMFFDDGTRFVAGLASTPLIQYYDSTLDEPYLKNTLVPYLRQVADFYMSYATLNSTTGKYDFPYTCAQETCDGGGAATPPPAQKNNHQDIAYATQTLRKLLEYTASGDDWGPTIKQDRAHWSSFLEMLVPFPIVKARNGTAIYADADYVDGSMVSYQNNQDYAIARYAAVFPAQLIGLDSSAVEKRIAWDTVRLLNDDFGWISSGGFDMNFPAASRTVPKEWVGWLLEKYTSVINATIGPNGYTEAGPGGAGLESIGGLEGIHSLMLQSHEGVIRIFPSWPIGAEFTASFDKLRANGAFLVSARWEGTSGVVQQPVSITSEKGSKCLVENPFVGTLCVMQQSTKVKVLTTIERNGYVHFETAPGVTYFLSPC